MKTRRQGYLGIILEAGYQSRRMSDPYTYLKMSSGCLNNLNFNFNKNNIIIGM